MTHSHAAATTTSTAAVVFIVLQGVTAGEILSHLRMALSLHFGAAIVVHVLTGSRVHRVPADAPGAGPALARGARRGRVRRRFVQAAIGDAGILAVHVPLTLLLLVGAVTVMLSSFWRVCA